MSSNVETILSALKTSIESVVGSGWKEMKFTYVPEKNDKRSADKTFGIGVGTGETVPGVNSKITKDTIFFVQLARRFANRGKDQRERDAINDIYEQLDLIDQEVFERKLGIQTVVLVVQAIGHDDPINIADDMVMVRSSYTIKHRK